MSEQILDRKNEVRKQSRQWMTEATGEAVAQVSQKLAQRL